MLARAIVIGIGLAIIYPALVYYGFTSIYPYPKFGPMTSAQVGPKSSEEEKNAFLLEQRNRNQILDSQRDAFSKRLLISATAFGAAAILGGSLISVPAISAGVMAGGTLAIGMGYWGYSSGLPEWWRFGSLLVGALCLVWVGYRQGRADRR